MSVLLTFYPSVYTVRVATLFICLIMHLCRVHLSVQLSVSTVLKYFLSNFSTSWLCVFRYWICLAISRLSSFYFSFVYFYIEWLSDVCLYPSVCLSIYKHPCLSLSCLPVSRPVAHLPVISTYMLTFTFTVSRTICMIVCRQVQQVRLSLKISIPLKFFPCCGSGMFIPDLKIFHPGSEIRNQIT
jgi:hypothetical protein